MTSRAVPKITTTALWFGVQRFLGIQRQEWKKGQNNCGKRHREADRVHFYFPDTASLFQCFTGQTFPGWVQELRGDHSIPTIQPLRNAAQAEARPGTVQAAGSSTHHSWPVTLSVVEGILVEIGSALRRFESVCDTKMSYAPRFSHSFLSNIHSAKVFAPPLSHLSRLRGLVLICVLIKK